MAVTTISAFTKKVEDLPDNPSANMTPLELKQWFDAAPEELRNKLNEVINYANSYILGTNFLINGNFDVWQRNTAQTSSGYGSDDRWVNANTGSTKISGQGIFPIGQTEVPNNPTYFSSTTVTSVAGAGNYVAKWQKIEDVTKLSGKTVTLSFWAKADGNKPISVEFIQSFGSGGSAQVNAIGVQKINLTTTWQKYTVTVTLPSVLGKTIGTGSFTQINLWFDAGSNFNADTNSLGQQSGVFNIAQVQLNEGDVALPFLARSYAEELRLCQRYYQTTYRNSISKGAVSGVGRLLRYVEGNCNFATIPVVLPVEMRVAPTCEVYSSSSGALGKISVDGSDVLATISGIGNNTISINVNNVATGLNAGLNCHYCLDAEL